MIRLRPTEPGRVVEVEGGVGVVVEPGQVEEVALPRALRLVGELVEEAVEGAERVAEAAHRLAEVSRALLGVGEDRAGLAGEGPDLVADRRRRLFEEALVGRSAGPSACACGISPISAGRAALEKLLTLAKAASPALRALGNSISVSWIACCWLAKLPSAALEEVTKRSISESWRPSSVVSRPKSWITRASATRRLATARLRSAT